MNQARKCGGSRGFSLLELAFALALSASAAAGVAAASRKTMAALQLAAAKRTAVLALLNARRSAYLGHQTAELELRTGARELIPRIPGSASVGPTFRFAPGIALRDVPARGHVRFYPSGLADNATITLGTGDATTSIVVNQRGIVHGPQT